MMMSATVTTPNFFDAGSPFLKHPLLTAERTAQEIDFIEDYLTVSPGACILDVGCGFGRHSIELARRGYKVTGIDPSAALIAEARKQAAEAGVSCDFRQERGESFSTDRSYDGAICLFTTLGQISDQGENSGLVEQVHSALKTGANIVVEVPQREMAVSQLKAQERFGGEKRKAFVHRVYNSQARVISEEFRIVGEHEEHTYLLKYKLYDRPELETLLARAGFVVVSAYGDYLGTVLSTEHPTMLMVARKRS
jgi:D-alanine-D-alanine ligase